MPMCRNEQPVPAPALRSMSRQSIWPDSSLGRGGMLRVNLHPAYLKANLLFWTVSLVLLLADDAAMLAMMFY
ncbi:MAG: hypothetical protein ACRYF5_18445 [Janthinobacterium lividum]